MPGLAGDLCCGFARTCPIVTDRGHRPRRGLRLLAGSATGWGTPGCVAGCLPRAAPELTIVDHSLERDVRAFESILSTIEDTTSAVTPIRPGLCALSVPSRYYGGEREAAAVIAEQLVPGVWECRIGIADGIFTAEQAARQAAPQDCAVIPTGGSARFLADLPIMVLEDLELVSLLRRLGIRTLGDFAALPARDVLTRFGSQGALIHRLAGGATRGSPPPAGHLLIFNSPCLSIRRWRPLSRSPSAAGKPPND